MALQEIDTITRITTSNLYNYSHIPQVTYPNYHQSCSYYEEVSNHATAEHVVMHIVGRTIHTARFQANNMHWTPNVLLCLLFLSLSRQLLAMTIACCQKSCVQEMFMNWNSPVETRPTGGYGPVQRMNLALNWLKGVVDFLQQQQWQDNDVLRVRVQIIVQDLMEQTTMSQKSPVYNPSQHIFHIINALCGKICRVGGVTLHWTGLLDWTTRLTQNGVKCLFQPFSV